jgi:superfamily II RNA helicase
MVPFVKAQKHGKRGIESRPVDMNAIVEDLRTCRLLPAIFFLKSRSDCDRALRNLPPSPLDPQDDGFEESVRSHVEPYPELKNKDRIEELLVSRAGSHHAGQLPGWRLLIEKMMIQGHLDVIFATSTVAAGVNFPARTVVLVQSDRFNGRGFVDMSATDIHQMTGRAGRRGMDKAGFIMVLPGRHMDLSLVKELLVSPPEPLQSKIAVNFSMVLNLLLSHDPAGVRALLGQSFAAFHPNPRQAKKVHKRLLFDFHRHLSVLQELDYVDEHGVPTYDGKWAARLRLDHPLLIAELIRQGEFDDLDVQELAALIAPLVVDKDKEYHMSMELWEKTRPIWKRLRQMARKLRPLMQFLLLRGFDMPSIMFWPAAAVFLWAEEVEWPELVHHVTADEGDLAMLMLRTADHLRQFLSLEGEQPKLAATAAKALQRIVRRPLV